MPYRDGGSSTIGRFFDWQARQLPYQDIWKDRVSIRQPESRDHVPYVDTLQGALAFLQQHSQLLASGQRGIGNASTPVVGGVIASSKMIMYPFTITTSLRSLLGTP